MSVILDGVNQYLATGNAMGIASTPFTVCAWAYPGDATVAGIMASLGDGYDDIHMLQAQGAIGGDPIRVGSYAGAWALADTTTGYSTVAWHHVAAVHTSATARAAFIDGGSKGTNADSQDPAGMNNFLVGTHKGVGGNYFKGKMTHVAIWSVALSDGEIATLAGGANPTTVQSGSLVGYWPLISNGTRTTGSYDLTGYNSPTWDADDPIPSTTPAAIVLDGTGGFNLSPTYKMYSAVTLNGTSGFTLSPTISYTYPQGVKIITPFPGHTAGWTRHNEGHDPRHDERTPVPFDSIISGTMTDEEGISIPIKNEDGQFRAAIHDHWWEHLHLLPRVEQELGNVVSDQSFAVDLFNAYRHEDITIVSVTDNLGDGITMVGVPATPFVIKSLDSMAASIEISSTSAALTIDGTYTFTDENANTYTIVISGTRIVMFPIRPEAPLREHLVFSTVVLTGTDGTEQRIANRKTPRSLYEMTIKDSRKRMEMLLMDRQGKICATPKWHEPCFLTADTSIGDLTVNVDTTAYADFFVDGYAVILQDEWTFDALKIVSMTATSLTFDSPLDHVYLSNNKKIHVMPLMIGWMNSDVAAAKNLVNVQTFNIRLEVNSVDNDIADASSWNTFDSELFLDDANMVLGGQLSEVITRKVLVLDNIGGVFDRSSKWDRSKRRSNKGFKTNTREELWKLRQLLHYLKGQQVSFYIPTFSKDLVPNTTLLNTQSVFVMDNIGYTLNARNRPSKDWFRMHLKDGTILVRQILISAEASAAEEQLTVDAPWPYDIDPDDIERCEFLEKVRINIDNIVITHYNALGQSKCVVPTIEVFD